MRVVVNGRRTVAERDDVAVAHDRDVVRRDAAEDAVDNRDFRPVFKREDAQALNRVAIVTMGHLGMSPDAVDEFVFDAVDRRDRPVRNVDHLAVRVEIDVLNVRDDRRHGFRPRDGFAVG